MAQKPNRHDRRSRPKAETTIRVPHHRAFDYREFYGDGAMVRLEGQSLIITAFINDASVPFENMELIDQNDLMAQYRPVGIEEKKFRTDVCGLRMSLSTFAEMVTLVQSLLAKATAGGQVVSDKKVE
jgi:hypothetical protein